jgi:nitrogen regulatory protein PII 1
MTNQEKNLRTEGASGKAFRYQPVGNDIHTKGVIKMLMIRSIVRPEKADNVLAALMEAGFPGITKMSVVGRGKQRGIKIGDITYDEIPKEMILAVVKNQDKDFVIKTIIQAARTGDKGAYGDGKIFVVPVEEAYTISSGIKETSAGEMTEVKI